MLTLNIIYKSFIARILCLFLLSLSVIQISYTFLESKNISKNDSSFIIFFENSCENYLDLISIENDSEKEFENDDFNFISLNLKFSPNHLVFKQFTFFRSFFYPENFDYYHNSLKWIVFRKILI